MEEIPLWSKKSLTQHARKVKETLTLLQQGKDEEAEVFVGNNTKQRNGKGMVARMLQEHLQKIVNIMLRQTPSQATELLEAESQSLETKEAQEPVTEEPTINHTEEIRGKRYQAMPEVDIRTVQEEKIPPGTMKEILVYANTGYEGASLITPI